MLSKVLRLEQYHTVSVVGAGGKTSLINCLTRELGKQFRPVLVTTTTKMFVPRYGQQQLSLWPKDSGISLPPIRKAIPNIIGSLVDRHQKLHALSKGQVDALAAGYPQVVILNEADGAAEKPFKAPRLGEPVVPESTDLVCCVVGMNALDRSLIANEVHRVAEIAKLTGLTPGERVTEEAMAKVYSSPEGYGPQRFLGKKTVLIINQVDNHQRMERARRLGKLLEPAGFDLILATSLHNNQWEIIK